jgi:hypothetical protein
MPDAGVDAADVQAAVLERHASSGAALRGVNVAGAEFGAPQIEPTSSFSNRDPGTYDTAYHYDAGHVRLLVLSVTLDGHEPLPWRHPA